MDNQLSGAGKAKPNDGMALFKNMQEAYFQATKELAQNKVQTKEADKTTEAKMLTKAPPPPPPPPPVADGDELNTEDRLELTGPQKMNTSQAKTNDGEAVPEAEGEISIQLSGRGPAVDLMLKLQTLAENPAMMAQVAESLGLDESKLREMLKDESPNSAMQLFLQANPENLVLTDRNRKPLKAEELAGTAGAQLLLRPPLQPLQPDLAQRVAQDQVQVAI